jgi:hypothetical protein
MHTTLFDLLRRPIYLVFYISFHTPYAIHLVSISFLKGWTSLEPKVSNERSWLFCLTKKFGSFVLLALDVGTIPHSRFMLVCLFAALLATVQVTLFLAC